MGAGHHGSVNGSPGAPRVRTIPRTPHIRVGVRLNETLHGWPNDVSEEMFARTPDKRMAYPGCEHERESQDDVSE